MGAQSVWESFVFAVQGLIYAFRTQRNFRIHCGAVLLVAFVAWHLQLSPIELLLLLSAVFAVLASELLNTAVEKTIDMYTKEIHPLARIAKNCAAAAVLLAAIYAVIVGLVVMGPKILTLGG